MKWQSTGTVVWRKVGRWYLQIMEDGSLDVFSNYQNGRINYGHTLRNGENVSSYTTPLYLQEAVAAAWKMMKGLDK